MTLSKFNELYTGNALVVSNSTIDLNATLLTNEEMQNIKAMAYITMPKYTWVPGYFYIAGYRWVGTTISVPYVYWVWVPSYKLWGCIPIPGHYEPRIGWRTIKIGANVPIIKYKPGCWRKDTYNVYIPGINDITGYLNNNKAYLAGDTVKSIILSGSIYALIKAIPSREVMLNVVAKPLTKGRLFVSGTGVAGVVFSVGTGSVDIRNHYVPQNYWQYFSYHSGLLYESRSYTAINKKTHYIDTIEVPIKSNGDPDWSGKITYISGAEGAQTVTLAELRNINQDLDWRVQCPIP